MILPAVVVIAKALSVGLGIPAGVESILLHGGPLGVLLKVCEVV